ncbi:MAG TPA: sulfatase-like hydrolase/transferase [Myxococcaceae bacterium]|nr:sulfatase-like hydrolase/transferase [Myxococcaceae bacterium]
MTPPLRRTQHRWAAASVAGAAVGLAAFAAESLLAVRSGAAGLAIQTDGPFAALWAAVRPLLPGLLLKVAGAYAAAGVLGGVVAWALAGAWGVQKRSCFWLLWAAELTALTAALAWHRAVTRPALFDDLAWCRSALEWLTRHGEPWHSVAFVLVGLLAHAAALLYRWRGQRGARSWGWWLGMPAALAGVAAAGWTFARLDRPGAGHPLVVLVGIDAFRPDRLRAYGSSRTVAPHVESFLRDATRFDRAYTPIAQTEPAWRSLLTARWPPATGVRYPLTAESRWAPLPTFAQQFTRAGYTTVFHTDCSRFHFEPESSGFTRRVQPPGGAINFLLEKLRYRGLGLVADNALGAWVLPEFVNNRALAGIHDPVSYGRRLARTLMRDAGRRPLLFAYHATAAHFPGDPVYPYYRQFVSPSEPLERRVRMSFAAIDGPRPLAGRDGAKAAAEALYDELLAQADAQLGELLRVLKEAGLYDEATVVLFSDHGESFHQDRPDLWGATPVHGARLGEEENRILLAIKLPKSRARNAPERVDALVRLVDVGPTLLALAGLPPLPSPDGVNLEPALRGESLAPLTLYAETGFTHATPNVFDPEHRVGPKRDFQAYQIQADGRVATSPEAHREILEEKDVAAFDGRGWWLLTPRAGGGTHERCHGTCEPRLAAWLQTAASRVSRVK